MSVRFGTIYTYIYIGTRKHTHLFFGSVNIVVGLSVNIHWKSRKPYYHLNSETHVNYHLNSETHVNYHLNSETHVNYHLNSETHVNYHSNSETHVKL
jgi:hypothetical protein